MSQAARKTKHLDIRRIEREVARVTQAYEKHLITRAINKQKRRKAKRSNDGAQILLEKNDKWVIRAIKKEQANKIILHRTSPEQWFERIESFDEPLRTKVCFLVWWDFFSRRRVTERWPHFDHILANHEILDCDSLNRDDLVLGLCNVGYTPYEASKRISESMDDE